MGTLNKDFVDYRLDFTMKILGKNIRSLRLERGMTQQALAFHIDSSQSVIHDVETKHSYNPTVFTIKKIATVLNVPMYELFKPSMG